MKRIIFTILFSAMIFTDYCFAVPARRTPVAVPLPDGTTLTVQLWGDEFAHYYTSADHYLLLKAPDGYFYYAEDCSENGLRCSAFKAKDINLRTSAETTFLASVNKEQLLNLQAQNARTMRQNAPRRTIQKATYPTTGVQKGLVILVEFADESFYIENPYEAFYDMLNKEGYSDYNGTGSARDYFIASSNGQFLPDFDVYGPVKLDKPMSYYGGNSGSYDRAPEEMIIEACQKLDDEIDFTEYDRNHDGQIDNVYVFYAGYGEATTGYEDTVWPHSWDIYDGAGIEVMLDGVMLNHYACSNEIDLGEIMMGIGTFCHEFSHVLGLPDFYYPLNSNCFTLGPWAIMDYGNYNNDGRTPPYYTIYERYSLGWITPKELGDPEDITLRNISENVGYIIQTENEDEYFLFENRQQEGWDKYIPGHGMLIWHIDYDERLWELNKMNMEPAHQRVDIIEADNKLTNKTRDGDPFPGTSNNTSFTDDTKPGMISWGRVRQEKPITDIREENGIIYFKVNGGSGTAIVNTLPDTDITVNVEGSKLTVVSNHPECLPLYITDIQGRLMEKSEIAPGTYSFPIVDKGIYFVRIGSNVYKVIR